MRASDLAAHLGLSKGRISQLVADNTLAGCYEGDGRNRVFDPVKCAAAMRRGLDAGQMLGNGSRTKARLREIARGDEGDASARDVSRPLTEPPRESGELRPGDLDRYELARAAKAEEDLRTARLRNGREEGLYVLASEVSREVSRAIGQEVSEVENYIRDTARAVADQFGLEFKAVRQTMLDHWRKHRGARADALAKDASAATMTDAEREADI